VPFVDPAKNRFLLQAAMAVVPFTMVTHRAQTVPGEPVGSSTPGPSTRGGADIRGDHQDGGPGEPPAAHLVPPAADGLDGELTEATPTSECLASRDAPAI
jgi:hypothetical protein